MENLGLTLGFGAVLQRELGEALTRCCYSCAPEGHSPPRLPPEDLGALVLFWVERNFTCFLIPRQASRTGNFHESERGGVR